MSQYLYVIKGVILRAWFVCHRHYLDRSKTFVLGSVFVLAHEQAISIPWVVDCKAPQFPIQIKGVGCDIGTLRGTLAVSYSSFRAWSELDSLWIFEKVNGVLAQLCYN